MDIDNVVTDKLNILERNICEREFVHHKSHKDWPVKWHQNPAIESRQNNRLKCGTTLKLHNGLKRKFNPEDGRTQHKKII